MATYYVSAQNGNDVNTGLSAALAWATIGKAVGEVAAGDTVYIGAGTYREKPFLTTAGTSGNEINFIGDPETQYLTGDNPGKVRITGCGVDELPTTGTIIDIWASNFVNIGSPDKGFNQIYVDGKSDPAGVTGAVRGNSSNNNQFIYGLNISVGARSVALYISAKYCIGITPDYGFHLCTTEHCISVGYWPFTGGTHSHSIGIGGQRTMNVGTYTNCFAIGGGNGFRQATVTNCIALGSEIGFIGASNTMTIDNCRAVACARAVYGESDVNVLNTSTLSAVYCNALQRGGGYETDTPTLSKSISYDLSSAIDAWKPVLQFDYNDGDNTASVGDYDILGQARRLIDGTIDIGPYAHSNVTTNFTEASPALEFTRAGMQKFVFWAAGGTLFTKKVSVKWSDYAGANKPQIIVDGDHVTRATTTATGDGTAYEEISVSATPTADGEVELFLYARDTDAAAKTYFKDLE